MLLNSLLTSLIQKNMWLLTRPRDLLKVTFYIYTPYQWKKNSEKSLWSVYLRAKAFCKTRSRSVVKNMTSRPLGETECTSLESNSGRRVWFPLKGLVALFIIDLSFIHYIRMPAIIETVYRLLILSFQWFSCIRGKCVQMSRSIKTKQIFPRPSLSMNLEPTYDVCHRCSGKGLSLLNT